MSVDFSQYVDLRILDVEPTSIYFDSINLARLVLPDFNLRPGTPEDAMFQAFAYMTAQNINAINRLPNSLMLGVSKMLGFPTNEGTRATLNAQLTAVSTSGAVVPAGTLLAYEIVQNDQVIEYAFSTNEILTIAAVGANDPLPTGTIACTSVTFGVIPTIANDSPLKILSYSQSLFSAKCLNTFVNGTDPETTDEFLNRATTYIRSVSAARTTKNQLQSYLLTSYPGLVTRAKVYDLTDSDGSLLNGEASAAGFLTIFLYGPNRVLTNGEKSTILADIESQATAGLDIGIVDPPLVAFNITATVLYDSTYDSTTLSNTIKSHIVEQFSPRSAQYLEEIVRYNDVLKALQEVNGVEHISSLSLATVGGATFWDANDGNNLVYNKKGTLLNLATGNITLTMTPYTPA